MSPENPLRIPVQGMSCSHCIARVERAVLEVEGVQSAHADLEGVDITGNAALMKREALVEAIREAGYTPAG
jgi:copper chaperone CopZ